MKTLRDVLQHYESLGFNFVPGMNSCIKKALRSCRETESLSLGGVELYIMEDAYFPSTKRTRVAVIVRKKVSTLDSLLSRGRATQQRISHEVIDVPKAFIRKESVSLVPEAERAFAESIGVMTVMLDMEAA
jgi:hypothetical protein